MNEFNKSVKQNNKSTGLIVFVAIFAISLCVIFTSIINISKANADPSISDLQATLDQTSCQYYDALQAQAEAQARVDQAESNIAEYNSQIEESRQKLATRAKNMYINGVNPIIDLLLGASTLEKLVNAIEYLTIMSNNDNALIAQCRQLRRDIEAEKATLDENLEEAKAQAAAATEAYNNAQAALEQAKSQPQPEPEPGGGGGHIDPVTGNAIADRALSEQGKPYVWGGVGPDGYDCSGLVSYAVSGAHTRIGTTSTFMGWPRIQTPELGCICTSSYHCGISVGGGSMCHAPTFGQTVCVAGIQSDMIYVTP